jgi:hypothetical protein
MPDGSIAAKLSSALICHTLMYRIDGAAHPNDDHRVGWVGSSTAGTGRSDAPHQQENDHDEQDCADDAHPAIAEAIAIAAEAAAEAAEQKYDQNYDKYGSKRHDEFSLSMIALIGSYHGLQWFLRAVHGQKTDPGRTGFTSLAALSRLIRATLSTLRSVFERAAWISGLKAPK